MKIFFLFLVVLKLITARKTEADFDIDSALCENRLPAFFVTDNADVSAVPSREITNITEEECRKICSENRDLNGRSVICASFSYDHIIFKCAIYRKRSDPDGDLERIDAPGKRYFEKFCLDESIPTKCANQHFRRIDDSVLVGYANSTAFFPTLSECLNECLKQGNICRSAMYFYNEGECIINVDSASNRPDDFRAPDKEDGKVVYFDNGCYQEEEESNVQEIKEASEEKEMGISKKKSEKFDSKEIKEEISIKKTEGKMENPVEVSVTEKPVEIQTEASVKDEEKPESEPKAEETSEPEPKIEEPTHPKDVSNRLYGAKQLVKDANGAIMEELASNSTSSKESSPEKEVEVDQDTVKEEKKEEIVKLPKVHKTNVIKSTVIKSGPTKNLKIQRVQEQEDDGFFSEWAEWTSCTQPGERRIRRRKCLDLKKCRGALMQVDWCPKNLPSVPQFSEEEPIDEPIGPVQTPIPVAKSSAEGSPPSILPPQMPNRKLQPLPDGAPGSPDDVWSPWLGVCHHFASTQPCKNNEVIGFESRECIAKDPKACNGPFFRYCTLPC